MSGEGNALMALKNAWNGAVAASDRVRELSAQVHGLDAEAPIASVDLDALHGVVLAQAIAVEALRGVIEQLRGDRAA